jgi:hypothetical protein
MSAPDRILNKAALVVMSVAKAFKTPNIEATVKGLNELSEIIENVRLRKVITADDSSQNWQILRKSLIEARASLMNILEALKKIERAAKKRRKPK